MTAAPRFLDPSFAVSPQLSASDIPAVTNQGFATLINNRPDGEGGSAQPPAHEIEKAAVAAGLHYVHLPVSAGALTPAQAADLQRILSTAPVPVLAFCRSGARSAQLYAMARAAVQSPPQADSPLPGSRAS